MTDNSDYQRPTITEIGALHEITLQGKFLGSSDGFTIGGTPIGNTGVSIILPN